MENVGDDLWTATQEARMVRAMDEAMAQRVDSGVAEGVVEWSDGSMDGVLCEHVGQLETTLREAGRGTEDAGETLSSWGSDEVTAIMCGVEEDILGSWSAEEVVAGDETALREGAAEACRSRVEEEDHLWESPTSEEMVEAVMRGLEEEGAFEDSGAEEESETSPVTGMRWRRLSSSDLSSDETIKPVVKRERRMLLTGVATDDAIAGPSTAKERVRDEELEAIKSQMVRNVLQRKRKEMEEKSAWEKKEAWKKRIEKEMLEELRADPNCFQKWFAAQAKEKR